MLEMGEKESHTTTVRERGQLTLPAEIRRSAGLEAGTVLEVKVEGGRVVMTPQILVDADQAWFWTERWQAMEREADEDFNADRAMQSDDVEGFLDELDS
jgi:AbrB family looped-hinge helix DNA binding protein